VQTIDRPNLATARPNGAPWSLRDAAAFLGVSPRHLARLIETTAVKSFKIGRRVFISDAELRWVAEHGTEGGECARRRPFDESSCASPKPEQIIWVLYSSGQPRATLRMISNLLAALLASVLSRLI
jgi:hypothetical protein